MVGTLSDRSRIGNDVSAVFSKFPSDVGCAFSVASAVFGADWRVLPVAPRIVNDVSWGVGVFFDGNMVFLLQWVGNGGFLRRC